MLAAANTTKFQDSRRPVDAAEAFFMGIKVGDTPDKSQFAKLAVEWIDQWTANMKSAFAGGL